MYSAGDTVSMLPWEKASIPESYYSSSANQSQWRPQHRVQISYYI